MQQQYRDPYREFIKIAPQNIMYDRRIVRGNTFAALVIPVNMQPEQMSTDKQKQRRSAYPTATQEYVESHQPKSSSHREQRNVNDWEELSDHSR